VSAGVVLAAGGSRRFGGPKQLAELNGRPLLEHAVRAMAAAVDRVVVVLGARADEVVAGADLRGAEVVVCAGWADGMSASLRCGLAALGDVDEVVVALADQPFVTAEAIRRVRATPGPAARAVYDGVRGDAGFRDLLGGAAEVECGDLADPTDIDTREDLEVVRR
jgi:CTP:molybdopterin cytidylyltransferase MocA